MTKRHTPPAIYAGSLEEAEDFAHAAALRNEIDTRSKRHRELMEKLRGDPDAELTDEEIHRTVGAIDWLAKELARPTQSMKDQRNGTKTVTRPHAPAPKMSPEQRFEHATVNLTGKMMNPRYEFGL